MFLVSIAAANVFFGASYIVVLTDIQIMDSAKKFSVRSIEILRTEQKMGLLYGKTSCFGVMEGIYFGC